LARLIQIPARASSLDVTNEFISYLRERNLGDIQLVPRDQVQQQVERALKVVEMNLEASAFRLPSGAVGQPCSLCYLR
jgi:hypothetical protein